MKCLMIVLLLVATFAFAEEFSIYPLTPAPPKFGTQLEPFLEGLEFPTISPTLEPFSMQYVYPDQDVLYSMQFVEPDPNTEFSMYIPETTPAEPEFELEFSDP